jgi:hypothetical protein
MAHRELNVNAITTEKQFTRQVIELAQIFGWRVYHTWLSIRSASGFPDLCLVRGNRLIFAELKSERGAPTPAQKGWLEALKQTSAEVYLWRPSDFDMIVELLR